jgi:predicted nuclease of predicted toxin-antitoxin system
VKLRFDENLSPSLTRRLAATYPASAHVRDVGLRAQSDLAVWEYAQAHGFTIASKDTDFRDLSFLRGPPPKVLWLAVGNAGTEAIAELLEARRLQIEAFVQAPEGALLVVELLVQDGA